MKHTFNTIIIAITIIVTALVFANAFKNRNRTNDIIDVTGLGKKDFVSDLIVWNGSFTRKDIDLKLAYVQLNKDREIIKSYLTSKGVSEKEIVFSSVIIIKEYNEIFDKEDRRSSTFSGYRLTQQIQIESTNVNKIENISREITELINTGVEFSSNSPEYYYTKLAELKVEMIAAATLDAKLRAEKIAENSGGKIGHLKYASMGVFQIVAQNSSEDFSWGGAYNTTSKRKTATITMKLQYKID